MSTIDTKEWDNLSRAIEDANSILLSTHINPDGDGLGSEIAFYYYLKELGKNCRIMNASPLPYNYTTLDPDNVIEEYSKVYDSWLKTVDLTIVFDIGDFRRTGPIGQIVYGNSSVISLDHHPAREGHPFDLNIVDEKAPATCYMIWKYFEYIDMTKTYLPLKMANALYAGLVTDTGSFKYQSTNPDSHRMAAYLIESGVNGYNVQRSIYEQNKLSRIKLMGEVIQKLQFSTNQKVAWAIINQEMIKNANASDGDVDGFTEFFRTIKSVEISFMILKTDSGSHRINFRSSGNYIVNDIAQHFDGGGHKFAAGARIDNMKTSYIESIIIKQIAEKIPGEFNVNKK